MRTRIFLVGVALLGTALFLPAQQGAPTGAPASQGAAAGPSGTMKKGDFAFAYSERGVSGLMNPNDPFGASIMPAAAGGRAGGRGGGGAQTLGLTMNYRVGTSGDWTGLGPRGPLTASPTTNSVTYTTAPNGAPVKVFESYHTDGKVFDWSIDLASTGAVPVTIGDLGITIPIAGPNGADPKQIFERGFLKHQFVSGNGSFIYYVRASGAAPFLLVTPRAGTSLEYLGTGARGAGANGLTDAEFYIHSSRVAASETRGTWRQPNTALTLTGAGKPGSTASYGFRMQWASSYDELRELLIDNGLFDVRVVPGMTVPTDLPARFSLRTLARIDAVTAEFPAQTTITPSAANGAHETFIYDVTFKKLGENRLTIAHDGGRKTYLEFFVTEPLETLIKKRASFLVNTQQIKDPSKWWNGVYAPYDAKAGKTRTIDDPDIFLDRMVYALTCDDPGLAKAPYLAEKNVSFPNQQEIDSIEYYIKNFVWGGLQRKDDERPFPYGVYGTPDWFVNRDPGRRKDYAEHLANGATAIKDLDKEHVWRSYDYPHIVMLYFHMYEIAKRYPGMTKYLDAAGYLNRAWETARAFYTYPYEIYPSYYETYKWGLYNELVVLNLIDALKQEGFPNQAAWLTGEWEKKVKYFVYDDQYPFRSEYAFDRTAFESSYAFAKYGATHDMRPDEKLWLDIKNNKWFSHPSVEREDSRAFMDRQLASGLAVRGWLNPAYYTLGSDAGMSYMAAMGGWGILDYGLDFAPKPYDWLQLGYASYLSSWALMNTGTAESNYGAWFPGQANDGAAGWQFTTTKVGSAWMGSSFPGGVTEPRGPWHYDGEIDLGFGGALRMAATIVTHDPMFGWIAYGGAMKEDGDKLTVSPRDGLRRRFDVVMPDRGLPFAEDVSRLKVSLDRDGFAATEMIALDKALNQIDFTVENRTGDAHATTIRFATPVATKYTLTVNGAPVALTQTGDWDYPWQATVTMTTAPAKVELARRDR